MLHRFRHALLFPLIAFGVLTVLGSGGGGGSGSNGSTLSGNNRLAGLALSVGALDQSFQPTQNAYTSSQGFLVTGLSVTPTAEDDSASITVNGAAVASGAASAALALAEGENLIEIGVVAENGASRTYELTVTRQAAEDFAEAAHAQASNAEEGDVLGASIAVWGDTMVVGAYGESSDTTGVHTGTVPENNDAVNSGAVYVFTRDNGVWSQQAYIKASNTGADDLFGYSIALSGDTLAVGAYGEASNAAGVHAADDAAQSNDDAPQSGAVYVFTRDNGVWSQQAYIKASNPGAGDFFGSSVALSGDILVVGAPNESSSATGVNAAGQDNDDATGAGAAYIFVRSGDVWSQQAYVKASNAGAGDQFGSSTAVSGGTVAVGAWNEGSNAVGINAAAQDNDDAPQSGAVYVFTRNGTVWSQQAYVKASNTGADDRFGWSVALSGDTLAVGALGEGSSARGIHTGFDDEVQGNDDAPESGAVYVFTRAGNAWSQQAYIKASNADEEDFFGISLALLGDTLAVGAYYESSSAIGVHTDIDNTEQQLNDASRSGAVYVFTRDAGIWSQQAYVKASNTEAGVLFGSSIALADDLLVVGAPSEFGAATGSGTVYVYD